MRKSMMSKLQQLFAAKYIYSVFAVVIVFTLVVTVFADLGFFLLICELCALLLFACRPGSRMHHLGANNNRSWAKMITILAIVCISLLCILPMGMCPLWNGEIPEQRNQYELMAENLLEGRLHFNYPDSDALLVLENPYDPDARAKAQVSEHWDHAYYKGQYYMYFGVVPVVLLFLPYRLLTGTTLLTYHAVQIFTILAVAGIFALFNLLAKSFFPKLPYSVMLFLSAAFSMMSVWYCVSEPSMYAVPIVSGIALMIWSLYCYIRSVWIETHENKQIALAGLGALLGALVFGCRPTIALANILVIPMLVEFLRQRELSLKLLGKLAIAALPYVAVAIVLMSYNYVRFENPLEFGQKYQITVADQSSYGAVLNLDLVIRVINDIRVYLFEDSILYRNFPYLDFGGVFTNFPILLLVGVLFSKQVQQELKKQKLSGLMSSFAVAVLIITVMEIVWTPYLLERYRSDVYFLVGIACYVCIGVWHSCAEDTTKRRIASFVVVAAGWTALSSVLFYFRDMDIYYSEIVSQVALFVYEFLR